MCTYIGDQCILKCLITWLAESKTSLNTSIAVGGAMAGLLVLIVVAIVLMLVARLHQQRRKKKKLTNLQVDIMEM